MNSKKILMLTILMLNLLVIGAVSASVSYSDRVTAAGMDTVKTSGNSYAILAGVSTYMDPSIDKLEGVKYDTPHMRDMLIGDCGYSSSRITTLQDNQATKSAIRSALLQMSSQVSLDDTVIFYFSGHGYVYPAGYGTSYIRPYDSNAVYVDYDISTSELKSWLDVIPCRNVLVIIDACESGAMIKGGPKTLVTTSQAKAGTGKNSNADQFSQNFLSTFESPNIVAQSPAEQQKAISGNQYVVLVASRSDEISWANYYSGSWFTTYFVEGIGNPSADTNYDNWVSAEEAFYYASPLTTLKHDDQHPMIYDGNPLNDRKMHYLGSSTLGEISVSSTPQGARIYLDGTDTGYITPATLTEISTGSHALVLKKSGYADYSTSVSVTVGQTTSVAATLRVQQTTGSINVKSTPTGATILLDGINKGTTPATLTGVSTGSHSLVLKKNGYADYSTSVSVTAGQTASVSATLWVQQTTGSINVKSTPTGATIVLDGMNKGTTPATLTGVSTGSHSLVLKKNGYADYSTSVTVTAGQTTSVAATLAPQQTTGSLSVSSTPSGATILLDGINKGTTPTTLTGISAGSHAIVLKKSGYPDYYTSVTVTAGQTTSVSATLAPQQTTGSLSVSSTPSGATILLDGINKGTTPATLTGISAGSHSLVLKKGGYPDYSASITVTAGQTASISATLAPQQTTGSLSVSSTPPGATILLDGINKGTTPTTLTGISAGSHSLVLRKNGYADYSTSVSVTAGQTASISATLAPQQTTGSLSVSSTPPGATILLDGINKGTTPATLTGISAGSHSLVLKKNGYPDYFASITVTAGQTASISATLAVQQPTGSLSVSSTPPGATILLDGINKGTTPTTLTGISAGSHSLVLRKSGYPDYSASITVTAGQTASISATLAVQQPTGSLSVSSTPPGATILLDGINKGTTPATLTGISAGSHSLVLRKSGYPDYSTSVTVIAGQTASISATLAVQQPTGSLSVSSTPPGATILLDGINKGTTPRTLTGISAGTHTIVLRKSGYPDYSASIIINAGQTASASINLGMNPIEDPVIGVWRYVGSTFDDRYHLYADGTYVESFYSYTRLTTEIFSGTWTANGGNSYALHQSDGTAFTMIYNPAQNTLYDTRYSSLLLTPYQGDVMKGIVLPGVRQSVNGVSERETEYSLLALNDKARAITGAELQTFS